MEVRIEAAGVTVTDLEPVVVPLVDVTGRSFQIYARVTDDEKRLAAGMSVTGWVPTGARAPYLTVPRAAVMRDGTGFYVFAGRPGHGGAMAAMRVAVDVLFSVGDRFVVAGGGLADDDRVVVEGNERLYPMMPIRFADDAPVGGNG